MATAYIKFLTFHRAPNHPTKIFLSLLSVRNVMTSNIFKMKSFQIFSKARRTVNPFCGNFLPFLEEMGRRNSIYLHLIFGEISLGFWWLLDDWLCFTEYFHQKMPPINWFYWFVYPKKWLKQHATQKPEKNAISLDSTIQRGKVEERVYHCKNETFKLNFLRTKVPPSDLQKSFACHRIWFGTINFAEKSQDKIMASCQKLLLPFSYLLRV